MLLLAGYLGQSCYISTWKRSIILADGKMIQNVKDEIHIICIQTIAHWFFH